MMSRVFFFVCLFAFFGLVILAPLAGNKAMPTKKGLAAESPLSKKPAHEVTADCKDDVPASLRVKGDFKAKNSKSHTPLHIVVPGTVMVECGDDTAPSVRTGQAYAKSGCDDIKITFEDEQTSGGCPGSYFLIRKWSATDSCGHKTTGMQTLAVRDTKPPVITAPADQLTMTCGSNTRPEKTGFAKAVDKCTGVSVPVTYEDREEHQCGSAKTIYRTWSAVDACENKASVVQTLRIVDTMHPVLLSPADVKLEYGESTLPEHTGMAQASDNCVLAAEGVQYKDVTIQGNCPHSYTIERTWSVKDACGNGERAKQTITVRDTHPPHVTTEPICLFPANNQWYCWDNIQANDSFARATDACGEVTREITACTSNEAHEIHGSFIDSCRVDRHNRLCVRAKSMNRERIYTVHFRISDTCGNREEGLQQTIMVKDHNEGCLYPNLNFDINGRRLRSSVSDKSQQDVDEMMNGDGSLGYSIQSLIAVGGIAFSAAFFVAGRALKAAKKDLPISSPPLAHSSLYRRQSAPSLLQHELSSKSTPPTTPRPLFPSHEVM